MAWLQTQLTNKQLLEMLKDSYSEHQNQSRKTAFGFTTGRSFETILGDDREPPQMAEGKLAAINDDPVARIFHRDNSDMSKCSPPPSSIRFEDFPGNTALSPPSAKFRQCKKTHQQPSFLPQHRLHPPLLQSLVKGLPCQ